MNTSSVRLTCLEPTIDGGWVIGFKCPDSERFRWAVSELKRRIDHRDRQYDPEARCWWIATGADLLRLDRLFSDLPRQMDAARAGAWEPPPRTARPSPSVTRHLDPAVVEAFAALFVTPDAPRTVAQAAYRALAHARHPDHGGDVEQMKALNLAFERVVAWYAAQEPATTTPRRQGKAGAA